MRSLETQQGSVQLVGMTGTDRRSGEMLPTRPRLKSGARGPPDLLRDFGRAPRQDVSGAPPGKRLLEGASNPAPVFALWGERLKPSTHRVARGVPASLSNSGDRPSGRASKWAGRRPDEPLSRDLISGRSSEGIPYERPGEATSGFSREISEVGRAFCWLRLAESVSRYLVARSPACLSRDLVALRRADTA